MKEHKQTKAPKALWLILPALLLLAAAALGLFLKKNTELQDPHRMIRTGEYNSVFLSMFPISTFDEKDFMHFRADEVLKVTYEIPNFRTLRHLVKDITESGNELRILYLGVDPRKVTARQILSLTELLPGVQLEVIPAYLPLTDWLAMENPEEALDAYSDLVSALAGVEHIRIFSFFAREWLVADPGAYESPLLLTQEAAHSVYLYTDELHGYDIRPEDVPALFDNFRRLLTSARMGGFEYPDFSDLDIVFFGDSVIGNFTGHHSIPGLVSFFSGARVYNCGYGGSSAAREAAEEEPSSLYEVLGCYLSGDISPLSEESQAHAGLKALLADEASGKTHGRKRLFVLYYGLNDYFKGCPADVPSSSEGAVDLKDPYTFGGSLRYAYEALKEAQPDAEILLVAPNYTTYFENGTMLLSENGNVYADYIETVRRINEQYGLPTLDIYHDVVTAENSTVYLSDGCHPNEYGHYRIARALISFLESNYR